jgi:hypothetical protein
MASTKTAASVLQAFLDAFNAHDVDRGCDLLELVDGKISRKDSFWKIVD